MTIGPINPKEYSYGDNHRKNEFPDPFYDCKLFSSFKETFHLRGRTRSSNNSLFLFERYQFSLKNILPLLESSSVSRK